MAIAAGNTNSLSSGSRTTSTLTKPSGVVSGGVMYAHLSVGNAAFASPVAVTPPSGWSLINAGSVYSGNLSPDNFILKLYVYRKVAGGSEGSSYSWTHSSAFTEGFIKNWTGVDNTTPEDKSVVENSSIVMGLNSGKTVTLDPGTSVSDGAQVVACDTSWDAAGAGSYSGSTPTLTTELTGGGLKVASGNLATAGAIGSRTRTNGNASDAPDGGWVGVAYVIRPAGGGGGGTKAPPVILRPTRKFYIPSGFRGFSR